MSMPNYRANLKVTVIVLMVAVSNPLGAQPWREAKTFDYRRLIQLSTDIELPKVVVVEFYAHGTEPTTGTVALYGGNERIPCRVMQSGPGDFCRIAFPTISRQHRYELYYGCTNETGQDTPTWAPSIGLIVETRKWKQCNLNNLSSVQTAFHSSLLIGSDYVSSVYHRHNPLGIRPGPFLNRYSGELTISTEGKYVFFTSSQDCSFLLIDGNQVVAAPGRHGPTGQGRFKGEITLAPGNHDFEYWHAASTESTCMVAAWQLPGSKKLIPIPPESFGSDKVAHLKSPRLEHRTNGLVPDFTCESVGDVPLLNNPEQLVRARFRSTSPRSLTLRARTEWEFGDGQSSTQSDPTHIFLHPRIYAVTYRLRRGSKALELTNRVLVLPALRFVTSQKPLDELDDYVAELDNYDVTQLDGPSLVQLLRALRQAKEMTRAAEIGRQFIRDNNQRVGDSDIWLIAEIVSELLLDRLDRPHHAAEVWSGSGAMMHESDLKVQCLLNAAEIQLHELLRPDEAQRILAQVADNIGRQKEEVRGQFYRLRGDWHVRSGDPQTAREDYRAAYAVTQGSRLVTESNAWRGAHSRSVESYLRSGELDQARDQLRQWQREFPQARAEGFLSLQWGRYRMARDQLKHAIVVAEDLLKVDPSSPHADKLVVLSIECYRRLGDLDAARAAYQSLITDYPGSPLIETVRKDFDESSNPER